MTRVGVGLLAAVCFTITASDLFAQATGGPFSGVFSQTRADGPGQILNASATLVEAYDDDILAESGLVSPGRDSPAGHYSMLLAGTNYQWTTRSVQFGMTGASAWRYYPQVGHVQSASYSAGIGMSARLAHRGTLSLNQTASYSPSYLFSLFPSAQEPLTGAARPTAADYAVNDAASYSYGTAASISRHLTRRASVSLLADYTFNDYVEESTGRSDLTNYGVRPRFSRSIGRNTAFSTGYRFRMGDFGGAFAATRTSEHSVEAGMDHVRVLSASRRATFAFNIGISTAVLPADPTSGRGPGRFYRIGGDGSVSYQLARTWVVRAAYRRGLEYIAQITTPVYTDGVAATVEGMLSRRSDLTVATGYSTGESIISANSGFDTYTGTVRSRFAITRTLAVYGEYIYYFYDFGGSALAAPGLPTRLQRNAVRAGVTLWIPTLRW